MDDNGADPYNQQGLQHHQPPPPDVLVQPSIQRIRDMARGLSAQRLRVYIVVMVNPTVIVPNW